MYLTIPVAVRVIKNVEFDVDPAEYTDDLNEIVDGLDRLVYEQVGWGEVDRSDLEVAALAIRNAQRQRIQ